MPPKRRQKPQNGRVTQARPRPRPPPPSAPVPIASYNYCFYCGSRRASLHVCSQCRRAAYCGETCQQSDWEVHKEKCAIPDKK